MPFPAMRRLAAAACFLTLPAAVMAQDLSGNAIAGVQAAMKRDFLNAYSKVGTEDRAIHDLVTWQRLRYGDAAFSDYVDFARRRSDWPGQDTLRSAGEALIPEGYDPDSVIGWFADTPPLTGEGAVRLAQALIAKGQPEAATEVVRTAWLTLRLSDRGQAALLADFGNLLGDLHATRTDNMLWSWRTEDAERMAPLLDEGQAALLAARLALIRRTGKESTTLDAVPVALRDTPGLRYDRFNWLATKGRQTDAIAVLRDQSTSADALGEPFRWSGWRRILARWQMREGNPQLAYELASRHFMSPEDGTESYADLEWLSGYLQLRFLDDPQRALDHFDNAAAEVDSPISLGRAGYWQGRAQEEMGHTDLARAAYARAAQHQTSFYGLLAAEKLGVPMDPFLTGKGDPRDWQTAPVMQDDMVRAGFALLEAGERGKAVLFFAELGKRLDAPDLSRLGAALEARNETYFEVLLGKAAAVRGIVVPSNYFPVHGLSKMELPVPMELALSIARRESEFNTTVGSPVGALGLMQLMPGTAKDVARSLALPYDKARLTADWRYNATLGARYLADLTERFGDSPVQIAAGYNAGPGRPRDWMDERGDPRVGEADVIDWIEAIPFRETRNYVQRVTESIPVYQARLSGTTGPIRFLDLITGEKTQVRPVARADGSMELPAPITGAGSEAMQPAALPRPVARPTVPVAVSAGISTSDVPPALSDVPGPDVQGNGTAPQVSLRPLSRPES